MFRNIQHKEKFISSNTLFGQSNSLDSINGAVLADSADQGGRQLRHHAKKIHLKLMTPHFAVLLLVASIIGFGYRVPEESAVTLSNQSVLDKPIASVDQIAAINVANSVAKATNMSVESNVSSLSISINNKTELAQTDSAFLSKPQIVSQTGRKDIATYIAKSGDTVQSVAASFGVSDDTIRWVNNLTSDSLEQGKQLQVLGITGILYTVKSGDDAAKIAEKYKADKDRIISFNDAELSGLSVGAQITIPDGILPENERPGYRAPTTLAASYYSSVAAPTVYGGNGYSYGYCTWYAFNRRAELGRPIGSNWGNAATWAIFASAAGFRVDRTPEAGAVLQVGGGYGHVAIVERVNDDGSIFLSEMNYAGWNIISNRTVPAGQVSSYNYIH